MRKGSEESFGQMQELYQTQRTLRESKAKL